MWKMPEEPSKIEFYNRYTADVESESVYGESYLRWIYSTLLGRLTLETAVKRKAFSRWYGWRMSRPASRKLISGFIEQYELDAGEFLEPLESYKTFNEFFYRKLKPSARPVAEGEDIAVFPADGRHLGFANVDAAEGVFVKGQRFDLAALLGSRELAERFAGGSLVLSRLCPVDYHRFHFPVEGVAAAAPKQINGDLYSVNPIALRQRLAIFWENLRYLTLLTSSRFGHVAFLEVGATCVGSVTHTHHSAAPFAKGDEKGYFAFGGSSVITIFEPGKIALSPDLLAHSAECREVYARMGDEMGTALS